jgi:predicted HTH domain antitoxin
MARIEFDFPDEILLALKRSPEEIGQILRLAASTKLYELGKISSGMAAQLAGIPRVVFLARLADFGVDTFHLTEEELQDEVSLAE